MFDKISNNYCGKAEEGETAMFEIAGLMVSGISLLNDLMSTSRDLKSWEEKDLLVDQEWLGLAIKNGRVTGAMESFCWAKEKKARHSSLATSAVNDVRIGADSCGRAL
jgi:hypothetical protein